MIKVILLSLTVILLTLPHIHAVNASSSTSAAGPTPYAIPDDAFSTSNSDRSSHASDVDSVALAQQVAVQGDDVAGTMPEGASREKPSMPLGFTVLGSQNPDHPPGSSISLDDLLRLPPPTAPPASSSQSSSRLPPASSSSRPLSSAESGTGVTPPSSPRNLRCWTGRTRFGGGGGSSSPRPEELMSPVPPTIRDCNGALEIMLTGDKVGAPMLFAATYGFTVPHRWLFGTCYILIQVVDPAAEAVTSFNRIAAVARLIMLHCINPVGDLRGGGIQLGELYVSISGREKKATDNPFGSTLGL